MSDTGQGKVLVISATDSFLAKSLVDRLSDDKIDAEFAHTKIREVDKVREGTALMILFMGGEADDLTETYVYLKDMAADLDCRIILVGDETEYDVAKTVIPDTFVLEWFRRPIAMDELTKCIGRYMEENTGENRKKTVLIVDDDITYMRTVYEWLKDNYHVGMAQSGVQAISYLARNKADLVLLDYEMPIANGPQVLEMLKNDSETDRIPVMFLTGHSDRESVLSVVGLSPADYLLKTIDRQTLLTKLDNFFKA